MSLQIALVIHRTWEWKWRLKLNLKIFWRDAFHCILTGKHTKNIYIYFLNFHIRTAQHLDIIKVYYWPTNAQSDCLKDNIKIDIKIAQTCFGAVTPSSGSALFVLAKVYTVLKQSIMVHRCVVKWLHISVVSMCIRWWIINFDSTKRCSLHTILLLGNYTSLACASEKVFGSTYGPSSRFLQRELVIFIWMKFPSYQSATLFSTL